MAKLANRARNVKTGLPITGGNVLVTGPDDASLATLQPDGTTGLWTWRQNGQPGRTKQSYTSQGQTKIVEGDTFGQAGTWFEAELPEYFKLFNDGVMRGVEEELAVTATTGMVLQVGLGMALIKGVLFPIYDKGETNAANAPTARVTIPTADAQQRIDIVAVRLERTTDTTITPARYEGRAHLTVVKGTAAASPVAPTLTQNANVWEIELARVTVGAGATAITQGNISTANKQFAAQVATNQITNFTEEVQDAVGNILVDSTSIDFTYNDNTPSITASAKFAGTGSASTVARSDHNHDGTYSPVGHTHSLTGKLAQRTNGSPPTIQATKSGSDSASCIAGEIVTGGGCRAVGTVNMLVRESYPGPSQSWVCSVINNDPTKDMTLTVYAMCLSTTV